MWPMPMPIQKPRDLRGPLMGLWLRDRKFDGHHVLAVWADECYAVSVREDVWGDYPRHKWSPPHHFPAGTVLDGELWWPNHPAAEVATALVECQDQLVFTPWSVLYWEGQRLVEPYLTNRRRVMDLGFSLLDDKVQEWSEHDLDEATALGYEGWVYKREEWWRWKVLHTVDCAVTGVVRGRAGKFMDTVGALIVSCWDDGWHEIAKVSGMTDAEREHFRYLIDGLEVGEERRWDPKFVVEVKYQAVTSGRRLQHPRFIRTRDDKSPVPSACVPPWGS